MILQTFLTLGLKPAIALAHRSDPSTAMDEDYMVKTALEALFAEHAVRPWVAVVDPTEKVIRVTGWSEGPLTPSTSQNYATADLLKGLLIDARQVPMEFEAGDAISFSLRTAPIKRAKRRHNDAAKDSGSPAAAYKLWLMERLTEERMGAILAGRISIDRMRKITVIRKLSDGPRPVLQPEILASGTLRVTDPARFEAFLRTGIGPQKGFGYGAILPRDDADENKEAA